MNDDTPQLKVTTKIRIEKFDGEWEEGKEPVEVIELTEEDVAPWL